MPVSVLWLSRRWRGGTLRPLTEAARRGSKRENRGGLVDLAGGKGLLKLYHAMYLAHSLRQVPGYKDPIH